MDQDYITYMIESYRLTKKDGEYIFVDPEDDKDTYPFLKFVNGLEKKDVEFAGNYLSSKGRKEMKRGLESLAIMAVTGAGIEGVMYAGGIDSRGIGILTGTATGALALLKHSLKALGYRNLNKAIQDNYTGGHPR